MESGKMKGVEIGHSVEAGGEDKGGAGHRRFVWEMPGLVNTVSVQSSN